MENTTCEKIWNDSIVCEGNRLVKRTFGYIEGYGVGSESFYHLITVTVKSYNVTTNRMTVEIKMRAEADECETITKSVKFNEQYKMIKLTKTVSFFFDYATEINTTDDFDEMVRKCYEKTYGYVNHNDAVEQLVSEGLLDEDVIHYISADDVAEYRATRSDAVIGRVCVYADEFLAENKPDAERKNYVVLYNRFDMQFFDNIHDLEDADDFDYYGEIENVTKDFIDSLQSVEQLELYWKTTHFFIRGWNSFVEELQDDFDYLSDDEKTDWMIAYADEELGYTDEDCLVLVD